MNDMNLLEHQLRGWKPRLLSPGSRARLFGQGAATAWTEAAETPAWSWLAPAMACLLLAAFFRFQPAARLASLGTNDHMFAMVAISNQNFASYFSSAQHSEQNAWTGATFDWTNSRLFLSSNGSFVLNTNQAGQ